MYTKTPIDTYKMMLTIACLAIDGVCTAAWLWPSSLFSQGASLIDVNIEGEEFTHWNFFGDLVFAFSLVDGR
jgi:hypothetical protein